MPIRSLQSRFQMKMLCWEQYISEDNPVRVVDAFVDYFEIDQLGFEAKGKSHEGRPAYSRETLIRLYIYGYLNRIRSSRQLEKATRTNIELFWLLGEARPCYKTIANFRKDNSRALRRMFYGFNRFLKGQELLCGDLVAIDGSKFGAQNSKKNNYNAKKVTQHLDYIAKQTNAYLSDLDRLDSAEESEMEQLESISEKLEQLQGRRIKYEALQSQLEEAREQGQTQVSTTDPDARALPKRMNIVEMGYNIQIGTESDNKLVTNLEVTNQNDTYALSDVAKGAKAVLEKTKIRVLADKGYDTGVELKICTENEIETYVSPRQKNTSKKSPKYAKEAFEYLPEKDAYQCPSGALLTSNGNWYKKNDGKFRKVYRVKVYKLPFEVCNSCLNKLECAGAANLKNSKGRPIERSEYESYLEGNRERVRLNRGLYRKRQEIVEHPFGTIKRQWGYTYTLLKGKEKVSGEFHLIFTCYNLRRAISIFGVKGLISRLRAAFWSDTRVTGLRMPPVDKFCLRTPQLLWSRIAA